jgi:hypothetical protein
MRIVSTLFLHGLIAATVFVAVPINAQQAPETFRWINFHSAKDQDVVVWVTRSLVPEKWTAIREIGVQYDAALVVTTLRATPQSDPASDTFTVWNLSLTSHVVAPLLSGVNLRFLDWLLLADGHPRELGALYDDCHECAASTFITAFYYDMPHHMWASRWMRGTQSVPVWSAKPPSGVTLSQLYAVLAEPNGRQLIGTWSHFDYGSEKTPEDSLYRYDLDPFSGLERTQLLIGKEAESMKQRLCAAQSEGPGFARGQDSLLCQQALKPLAVRKPNTKPPANNHGQSQPPEARH